MGRLEENLENNYHTSVTRLRDRYILAECEESKHTGYSQRAIENGASDDFDEHIGTISEFLREEVRDEEMRIAAETYEELERDVKQMERQVTNANALALEEIASYLRIIRDNTETPADGEAWAYQDGYNAALDKVLTKIRIISGEAPLGS